MSFTSNFGLSSSSLPAFLRGRGPHSATRQKGPSFSYSRVRIATHVIMHCDQQSPLRQVLSAMHHALPSVSWSAFPLGSGSYPFSWEHPTHPGLPRSPPCVLATSSLTTLPVVPSRGVCDTDQQSAPLGWRLGHSLILLCQRTSTAPV